MLRFAVVKQPPDVPPDARATQSGGMPANVTKSTPHRVVLVGGGFGGLYCAQSFRRAPVQVTLVDRRNFHLFQPLLYQVATAALSPGDIAGAIRAILRGQKNLTVWMG